MKARKTIGILAVLLGTFWTISSALALPWIPPNSRGVVTFASHHRWEAFVNEYNRQVYEFRAFQLIHYTNAPNYAYFELNSNMGLSKNLRGYYYSLGSPESPLTSETPHPSPTTTSYKYYFILGGDNGPDNLLRGIHGPAEFNREFHEAQWYEPGVLADFPRVWPFNFESVLPFGLITPEFSGQYRFVP